ncbi:LPS export ABC transporter periplasmic protein LptC [Candidatus Riflebacteria bacterium]
MWEAIKLLLLILFLCTLALLGDKMENIISQSPTALEFEKVTFVLYDGDIKSAIINAKSMNYQEKTGLSILHDVVAEVIETDKKSPAFGEISTITSKIAENKGNQTIFRRDVVINTPKKETLTTDVLHYYSAPYKRMFCPKPVKIDREGMSLSADLMDNIESPFMKKYRVKGHVHLEIEDL